MLEVRQTSLFRRWLDGLADKRAMEIIARRIVRLQSGLFGDTRSVRDGVSELKIDHGPGYRLYFTRRKQVVVILLCGGTKGSQNADIKTAKQLARQID